MKTSLFLLGFNNFCFIYKVFRYALLHYILFFSLNTYSQNISFPDINLRLKLLSASPTNHIAQNLQGNWVQIDINGDYEIQVSEAQVIKELYIGYNGNFLPLTNLNGLESFLNLEVLNIQYNSVSSYDFSNLSNLKNLGILGNNFTTLNLNSLLHLESITCDFNNITFLDVSHLTNLTHLSCSHNLINHLDLNTNPLLTNLFCSFNNLSYLSIKNGALQNVLMSDCWKDGNPNLTTVCADATEVASVQAFLDSCGSSSQTVTVTSSCSMATETAIVNSFTITPNPSSGVFTIAFSEVTSATIGVYNVLGQEVMSLDCAREDKNVVIDLTKYPSGVYLMVIESEQGIVKERIIKN